MFVPPSCFCPCAVQIDDVDAISDALLIQGLWAAAEAVDEDEDGPAENADLLLEQLAPLNVRDGREETHGKECGCWACSGGKAAGQQCFTPGGQGYTP